jgi:drug/metabolite transporter (DMT)-like permease
MLYGFFQLMSDTSSIFVTYFICGFLFYRLLLAIAPQLFRVPGIRTFYGIGWHHWHTGILLILAGAIVLVLDGDRNIILRLLGLGLGLTLDVFIPFFYIKTEREEQLREYRRSLVPTLVFAGVIVLGVLLLSFIR